VWWNGAPEPRIFMKSKTFEGAIDNVELGNLTGLLAKIKPAVKATSFKGERASKKAAFVDTVDFLA
jgi:hypothetical protein